MVTSVLLYLLSVVLLSIGSDSSDTEQLTDELSTDSLTVGM